MNNFPTTDHGFFEFEGSELASEVTSQLEKDFSFFQLDLPFSASSELDYAALLVSLTEVIEVLMERDIGKLFSLLYRIDIDEQRIRNTNDGHEFASPKTIAEIIIKRELQKVVLRKHFQNQQ
jgi:hypothetical protein